MDVNFKGLLEEKVLIDSANRISQKTLSGREQDIFRKAVLDLPKGVEKARARKNSRAINRIALKYGVSRGEVIQAFESLRFRKKDEILRGERYLPVTTLRTFIGTMESAKSWRKERDTLDRGLEAARTQYLLEQEEDPAPTLANQLHARATSMEVPTR